jgi:hypothetical protein
MNVRQLVLSLGLVLVGICVLVGVQGASTPIAPNSVTPGLTSTFNASAYAPVSASALAGNITALVISGIGQTKSWQGYYGNITGTITLDDAQNFTFYNWTSTEPRGQIYATLNNSIAWTTVECFNYTADGLNETNIANYYGISPRDNDNINYTFNQTDHPSFQVGSRTMTTCPTTYIHQDDAYQQANFVNVLLWDITNNDTGWIYTTLIENKTASSTNDLVCYNGQTCDFQILVNENGHGTDTSTTLYYFWVELI